MKKTSAGGRRGGKGSGSRRLSVRVRTARRRKASSTRWLERQLNDPYVAEAERLGYRSRAAFKLIELDDRFHFLAPGKCVVDLGAAPGGWTLVAAKRVAGAAGGRVVAVDATSMEPVADATIIERDFLDEDAPAEIEDALGGPADVVLSDMAPAATGHAATDHLRIMALCETALAFATRVLTPGGAFIAKVLQGGTEGALLAEMKRAFKTVKHAKPLASRPESAEVYVVALGFRNH
ncbi:MAG: RlmE family RNA methyltransferase [Rhodospirillales bacterium]|nr:RlmE family RNA methyltransferase [Rhodospirillales bacterium]HJO73504.1 RlmE family RNA methyltransferase [Rhodospirillales bacterium]